SRCRYHRHRPVAGPRTDRNDQYLPTCRHAAQRRSNHQSHPAHDEPTGSLPTHRHGHRLSRIPMIMPIVSANTRTNPAICRRYRHNPNLGITETELVIPGTEMPTEVTIDNWFRALSELYPVPQILAGKEFQRNSILESNVLSAIAALEKMHEHMG